jgi:hypothetical protein
MDLRQLAMDSGILERDGSHTINIEVMGKKLAMDSTELMDTLHETNINGMRGEGFGMCLTGNRKRDHEILILDSSSRSNQFKRSVQAMLMDDDYAYNIPSSGVPNVLTTVWTTRFFKQIYQSTPFRELTTPDQQGVFGTTNVKYPLIQGSGVSKLYADHAGLGDSSMNLNYLTQQTVTLQRTLTYGDMQTAVMGMAKVDYVAWLREYTADLIALDQNNIGFNGFDGMQCYGLLNNPGLLPEIAAANGQWVDGDYASVVSDIITTVQSIQTLGAGQVKTDSEFIIGLPPVAFGALLYQNSLGMSVKAYIEGVYTKCKFIQVQNYTGTGTPLGSVAPNRMQVIFKQIGGQDTALGVFSSLYNSHGVVRLLSSYNEKISYVLAGTVLTMPIGVATMSGI